MKKSPSSADTVSASQLEEQGLEQLRRERFKDAIETFKRLVRQDPQPLWKQSLNHAYAGRARALAAKGMVKEAQITLENTADSSGLVQDIPLYFLCLVLQKHYQKAISFYRKVSDTPAGAAFAEAVCVMELIPPNCATPAGQALNAWYSVQPAPDVEQRLQAVSLRSPARSLRAILKALLLSDADAEKRNGLLNSVGDTSVFAGLARAARAAFLPQERIVSGLQALTAAERSFVIAVRGIRTDAAKFLHDIEQAERRGPKDLLRFLIAHSGRFPKEALRAACLDLLPHAPELISQVEQKCGVVPPAGKFRIMALHAELHGGIGAERYWDKMLDVLDEENAEESRMSRAIICRHLAEHTPLSRSSRNGDKRPGKQIVYLERSLDLDPDHMPTVIELIKQLDQVSDDKEWTKRVDWAIARFPKNVAILENATESAFRRKTYKKAASYVQQLLKIDPINQSARRRIIELSIAQARKQMRSNRADLALKELRQAATWERSDQPSRELALSRALVEKRLAPAADSDALVEAAATAVGSGAIGWLHALQEAWLMGWPDSDCTLMQARLAAALTPYPTGKQDILTVTGLLGSPILSDQKKIRTKMVQSVEPWLTYVAKLEWTSREFQEIAEILRGIDEFRLLSEFARQARRRDPKHPAYHFYEIVAETKNNGRRLWFKDVNLNDLYERAAKSEDLSLANRIANFVNGSLPPGMMDAFDDDDDDFFGDDGPGTGLMLDSFLDAMGADKKKSQLLDLARTGGVDAVVDQMLKMIAKRTGASTLPLPKVLMKEVLREMIQMELAG